MSWLKQIDISSRYAGVSRREIIDRIGERKQELAADLLILCHHYQQDDIYQFADLTGDSLKLSREAAAVQDKKYLIFCGVHFMAEAADILAAEHQTVILPHLDAGCPMADMATSEAVAAASAELCTAIGLEAKRLIPVTYVNSSAAVKAFVGEQGGSVCTSSNAEKVLQWALDLGEKVFFFPDQHLGRNASLALGIPEEEIVLWRRGEELGGCPVSGLRKARVILWDGYCEVHMRCFPEHVREWRLQDPEVQVMVHPECRHEVVREADYSGSTEAIIRKVGSGDPGSHWIIGTEINLVQRLAAEYPDRAVDSLTRGCLCPTMDVVRPPYLLWILDNLAEGRVVNRITVAEEVAAGARQALNRMLSIS